MADYISKENNFGKEEIKPLVKEDLKVFKKTKFHQPMAGERAEKVIEWVKSLMKESYQYKKELHLKWYNNALDYYTMPSFDSRQRAERKNEVDLDQDTEVMVPALIKRYVDLGAFWLTRQIFKIEPFVQYTSYSDDDDVRKAQKLYERKVQGDTEAFGARDRATQLGIDLFLYGNSFAKVNFFQDRLLVQDYPDIEIDMPDEDELLGPSNSYLEDDEADSEEPFGIKVGDQKLVYDIVEQYSEFQPIFLGHMILDPMCPNRDWRRASFMGDVEFLTLEQIYEAYGNVKGVKEKLNKLVSEDCSRSYTKLPMTGDSDIFIQSWLKFSNREAEVNPIRKVYPVTHMYTRYTETCIIGDDILVYHKYRSKEVSKAGAFPYVMFQMPRPTAGLYSVGYGHILRTLQLEQIILASKRLQSVEEMNGAYIQYIGKAVDEDAVKQIGNLKFIEVDQPGAIQETVPNHSIIDNLLNAESRNFERSREYCGIPGMLDGSDTKTHLGAVQQRMEASQVQFDVILDSVRDGFKEIFNKIHVLNMAYLDGDVQIKGKKGSYDNDYDDNVLSAEELMLLANEPDLSIQLNLGSDIGAEKLKAFSALLNVQLVNQTIAQLQQAGQIAPDKLLQMLGMLFDLAGLTEFRAVFSKPEQAPTDPGAETGADPMAATQGAMEAGAPGPAGAEGAIPPQQPQGPQAQGQPPVA